MSWAVGSWRRSCLRRPSRPRAPPCAQFRVHLVPRKADRRVARQPDDALMLFADSEDEKKLWLLYKYSWGGTVVAGLDAVPLCTTPTPPPSSAAWPLGAAAQAAALHSKPGAWLKPRPTGAWQRYRGSKLTSGRCSRAISSIWLPRLGCGCGCGQD